MSAISTLSYAIPPPIFNGENYQVWSIQMKTLLQAQGLWEVVENEYKQPNEQEMKTWDEDNKKVHGEIFAKNILALSFIHRRLSPTIFPRVMAATTAHDAWKILQDAYKGSE